MNDRGHLSADVLDGYKLGILPLDARAEVESHLSACPGCQAAFRAIEDDYQVFQESVLPRTAFDVVKRAQARGGSRGTAWRLWVALPLAGATVAVALLVVILTSVDTGNGRGAVRVKGDPALRIYAKRGESVFTVRPGDRLRPGDRIRFVIEPAGSRYLLIVSQSATGALSLYHPPKAAGSGELRPGRAELPGSIELDEAPGTERIISVFSNSPLLVEEVMESLRRVGDKPPTAEEITGARHVVVFDFEKELP